MVQIGRVSVRFAESSQDILGGMAGTPRATKIVRWLGGGGKIDVKTAKFIGRLGQKDDDYGRRSHSACPDLPRYAYGLSVLPIAPGACFAKAGQSFLADLHGLPCRPLHLSLSNNLHALRPRGAEAIREVFQ